MRSNCLLWSARRYAGLVLAWLRAGRPDQRPVWRLMPSRSRPWWSMHWQVEFTEGGRRWIEEFVPVDRRDIPWWLILTRLMFVGRVERRES